VAWTPNIFFRLSCCLEVFCLATDGARKARFCFRGVGGLGRGLARLGDRSGELFIAGASYQAHSEH
jgi:hypothetical protein